MDIAGIVSQVCDSAQSLLSNLPFFGPYLADFVGTLCSWILSILGGSEG